MKMKKFWIESRWDYFQFFISLNRWPAYSSLCPWYPATYVHEDTSSLLPNRHPDRADALPLFLFEIPFSIPFLDTSAIVVWWHLWALQQMFFSFSWAFFVRVLPQNNGKLDLLGMKRRRLTFLPCRRHRSRHLHQTHPSSLSFWFVVMCRGLKSPSKNSDDLNQQDFVLLHMHPGMFKIWGNYDTNTWFCLAYFRRAKVSNTVCYYFNKELKKLNSDTCLIVNSIRSEISILKQRVLLIQQKFKKLHSDIF